MAQPAVPQRLTEFIDAFESRFAKVVHGNHAFAPTNEPYVEFISGGHNGGLPFECYCLTPEYAVEHWIASVERYAKDRVGVLYWRIRPELDYFDYELAHDYASANGNKLRVWKVYGRLLISDKEAVRPAILPVRTSVQELGYTTIPAVET